MTLVVAIISAELTPIMMAVIDGLGCPTGLADRFQTRVSLAIECGRLADRFQMVIRTKRTQGIAMQGAPTSRAAQSTDQLVYDRHRQAQKNADEAANTEPGQNR
jgi:hypothetical protein